MNHHPIPIRPITESEVPAAASVLARGMRDNPLHLRALGEDPERRVRALAGVFRSFLGMEVAKTGRVLGAFQDAKLVGVCRMMRPGCCQLAPPDRIALLPRLLWHCGPGGTGRMLTWFGAWARHDPAEPHWHLGPVGIEPELQGRGIGSLLLREFCRLADAERAAVWLETDKIVNVPFYQKHGFAVSRETAVIGVPNWFMRRPPAGGSGSGLQHGQDSNGHITLDPALAIEKAVTTVAAPFVAMCSCKRRWKAGCILHFS